MKKFLGPLLAFGLTLNGCQGTRDEEVKLSGEQYEALNHLNICNERLSHYGFIDDVTNNREILREVSVKAIRIYDDFYIDKQFRGKSRERFQKLAFQITMLSHLFQIPIPRHTLFEDAQLYLNSDKAGLWIDAHKEDIERAIRRSSINCIRRDAGLQLRDELKGLLCKEGSSSSKKGEKK